MAFRASHRFARISARKVRPLADLVRGKFADEALDVLRYQPQRGARLLEKVLKSALGSAQDPDQNSGRNGEGRAFGGGGGPRRRRADVQADSSACARHGVHDPQAVFPYLTSPWKTLTSCKHGSESKSDRLSHGRRDGLEEPLVRLQAGVRGTAAGRPEDPPLHQEPSASGRSTATRASTALRSSGRATKSR